MNISKLNRQQKIIMGIVLGIVFLIAAYLIFFVLGIRRISVLKNKIHQVDLDLQDVTDKINTMDILEESLKTAQENLAYYQKRLPKKKDIPELLSQLANLAEGLSLSDYSSIIPATLKSKEGYSELPISITLRCSYSSLQKYLHELESLVRIVSIQTMDLRSDPNEPLLLDVELRFSVFVIKDTAPTE